MNNADKIPTIARLSFRIAPEHQTEFEQVYADALAPILQRHGLVALSERGRATPEDVFIRLFEVATPEEVLEKKNALNQDPAWQVAVQNLSEWFRTESHEQGTFKLYGMPAVPEKTVPAGGGTGRWHSYDVGNGLGDGEVRAICQDRTGYMWFATRNGGVSRFDGRRFATFGLEEGLADRTVLSMIQDRAGYFWFGTLKGVSRYAPWESADLAWRTFTTQDGLAHNIVRAIFQDQDGYLWFGTQGNGVSRFDGKHFTTFNKTNGLTADYVATIFQDREGTLYFGTGTEYSLFDVNIFHGNGVSRFDGWVWTTFTTADGLAGNDVKAILQDRKGRLWVGTNNGMSRFDGQAWHTAAMPEGLLHREVFVTYEDLEGQIWFGILQGGAICYNDNAVTHYTTEHGLLHNWVHAIFQDREGHLWFGNSGGVSRYDGQVWRTFTTEDGMVSNDGIAVFQDREGELWFKTHRGLARHRDRAFQTFLGDANLPLSGGTGVFQQRDGTLWICAGNKGALRYNGHVFSVFTTEDGLADGCFAVFEDREKNLWFGTSGGVSRYDGRTFTSYTVDDGLATGGVWSIFQDQAGDIWVVTFFGISRYDGGRFRTFTLKDGMAHDIIWSGLQDRNGVFWFGTSGGVSRYDGRQFVTITTKDGLVGNIVRSIFEDQNGHLWFGSQGGGVSRYDGRVFQTITPEDGLAGNLVRSIFEDRDGQIWFSTSSGFTRFRQPEPIPPPVFIDAVVADRRYERISELELSAAVGLTAFEFHGMSLKTRPEAMVYRYRLTGYEADWRTTRTRRVEYENLPPGDYTFEVVAVDRDLVYSESLATVRLHVVRDARDAQIDELDRRVQARTRELEAANRDLVIEAALERVRAKALGMQTTDDLSAVSAAVFREFRSIYPQAMNSVIGIVDEGQDVTKQWTVLPDDVADDVVRFFEAKAYEGGIRVALEAFDLSKIRRINAFCRKWFRSSARENESRHMSKRFSYSEMSRQIKRMVELDLWSPEQGEAAMAYWPDEVYLTVVQHKHGYLFSYLSKPLTKSEVREYKRFAKTFSFAYDRFLDMQDRERRAREAARQAAVDRVRAEIATMRTSADLEQVTPLIWKELTALDVSFVRCGVFILDEETQRARLYLTNPRGASLASLELPFGSHPYIAAITDAWRQKKVYVDRWDQRAFQEWMAFLQTQGYAVQPDRYQDGAAPPEMLVLQCVPFVHGMLYVGSIAPLSGEDIGLVQSLVGAFSVAYARYLDFQKLEAQNRALEEANAQVREATQRKSAFLASMSHELRTPMNAIIGFTRLVLRREPELTLRGKENLEKVAQASNHLMGLINDILDLSKIEAGKMDVVAKRFDVKHLIGQCVSTVSPLVKEGVALRCEVGEGVGEAFTDEGRVRQIVINLLSNAVKFTEAGEVRVVCEVRSSECGVRSAEKAEASLGSGGGELAPDVLKIIVRDTGVGIPKDKLGSIFEEFVQVSGGESSVQRGTGLGLSITKKFAELLGGTIEVESEVGKGSAFTVRIPAVYERGRGQG